MLDLSKKVFRTLIFSLNIVALNSWCSEKSAACFPDSFGGLATVGIARDLMSGELMYCEWHTIPAVNNTSRVEYRTADTQIFATKTLQWDAEKLRPNVEQMDSRSGELLSAKLVDQHWLLKYQKNSRAEMESTTVDLQEVDIVDAGFDQQVRNGWGALLAGYPVRANFAHRFCSAVWPCVSRVRMTVLKWSAGNFVFG